MTSIKIPGKEIKQFHNEYAYESPVEIVSHDDKHDAYKNHLSEMRKKFHSVPRSNFRCVDQDMFKDRVKKQRELIAKYCNNCKYEFDCAYLAVLGKEKDGVWGGLETKTLKSLVEKLDKSKFYEHFDETKNDKLIKLIKDIKSDS